MSKKMKILIFSSLLLNVLLVGVVIGDVTHRFHIEHFVRKPVKEFASKLPEDKAALFLETVERVHLNNRDAYNQLREARKEAMKFLSAPEFDEAAYRLQIEKIHELRSLMKRRLAGATIELARQFSQKERRALSQHLRHFKRRSRDSSLPSDAKSPRHENP
ncbi:MAG: periplasmic heavy metal sensor [Desulfobacterales bacterium]|uniref:Periplasmic heavy metal sensor n=1 Tax=Candidatus Desulfatibia vada TaxID=2841696 RepID=A0A8J6TLP0_9BACT|nr:periplasmic heavy metal sensor [Candidatus Desulfatibia vada]MBL6971765.1 periplasmic heavy metal sensor [Desulfobacterales bacterium]